MKKSSKSLLHAQNRNTHNLKYLTLGQKVSVALLFALLITIPVAIFLAVTPIKPIKTPATGPITPPTNTETPQQPPPTTIGNVPVFITQHLSQTESSAKLYRTQVEGYDNNPSDSLSIEFSDLPEGVSAGNCVNSTRRLKLFGQRKAYVKCFLSGKISNSGEYLIGATLSDGSNSVFKTFAIKTTE